MRDLVLNFHKVEGPYESSQDKAFIVICTVKSKLSCTMKLFDAFHSDCHLTRKHEINKISGEIRKRGK